MRDNVTTCGLLGARTIMPSGPLSSRINRAMIDRDLRKVSDGDDVRRDRDGFLPRTRRVLIRHGQHLLDERGNVPGFLGLFLRSDRQNAACGVVAGDTTRRRRAGMALQGGFLTVLTSGFLIEHTHCLAPLA